MAIWNSCNADIPRSLNSRDSFLRRKFENRAPKCCRPGPVLSRSTVTFELPAEMLDEIDLEKCNFRKFSEIQKPRELDVDLGSGQCYTDIHSTCRTTSVPNRVTVSSRSTEIWPFESRKISTFRQVWTPLRACFEGNSKIGLRQAVGKFPCYHRLSLILSHTPKWRRRYI